MPCYSGTPPYDHPVYKTTSLLRPYSFKPNVKTIESFYYFEDPVNATTSLLRPGFYGPTVVALTGFHSIVFYDQSGETLRTAPTHLNGELAAGSVEIGSSRERAPAGRGKGVHQLVGTLFRK